MLPARGHVGMRGEAARGQAGTGTRGQGIPKRARARARAGAKNARGNKVGAAPRAALATPFILGWRVAASGGGWRVRCTSHGETGNQRVSWGAHLRVTGDGNGHQEFRRRQ